MGKQAVMKGFERPTRTAPRVMAHMIDAGGECGQVVHYKCGKCGWDSGWVSDDRCVSAIKRGIPCEICNVDKASKA